MKTEEKKKTALERAQEMMQIPRGELPEVAKELAHYMSYKLGVCMEVMLTAYAIYAQEVEGLKCDDELYKTREPEKSLLKRLVLKHGGKWSKENEVQGEL